jgi:hypothetical protein
MPMTELDARAGRRSIMPKLRFTLDGAAASKSGFMFGRHYYRLCLPFCYTHAAGVSNRGPATTATDIHWHYPDVIPLHRAAPRRMACNPYPLPDEVPHPVQRGDNALQCFSAQEGPRVCHPQIR